MSNNKIDGVHEDTFKGLVQLEQIDLSENEINNVHKDTFKGLVQLKKIILFDNNIGDIHSKIFQDLYQLTEIYLHNNNDELKNRNELKLYFEDKVRKITFHTTQYRDSIEMNKIHNVILLF